MKKLFSIYDEVAETWSNPITVKTEALFLRDLKEALKDNTENWLTANYKDKTAYSIGEFDEMTGKINLTEHKQVAKLANLKEDHDK